MTTELTPKQQKAATALVTCGDISAAATAAGVARNTLYRWMALPAFRSAVENQTQEAVEALSRRLAGLGEQAIKTLQDGMDGVNPVPARLRAADIVLGRLLQLRELATLERRLSELEARFEHQG